MKVRVCRNCGAHNPEPAWHCSKCGEALSIDTIMDEDEAAARARDQRAEQSRKSEKAGGAPARSSADSPYEKTTSRPQGKWKCPKCGGMNPPSVVICFGCKTPWPSPEAEARRQEAQQAGLSQTIESIRSEIKAETKGPLTHRWEYALVFSGGSGPMSEVEISGLLSFLSSGKDIELPGNSFLDAIDELGQQGWELVGIINWSDEGFQVPTENLIPRSSYFISALLKTHSPHGVYVQQTGRITAQLGFVFKRQVGIPAQ